MFSGGYLMSILLSNILFRLILTFTIPLLNKSSQSLFKQSADRKKSKILFLICLYIVCFCHNKKKINKKLALSIFFCDKTSCKYLSDMIKSRKSSNQIDSPIELNSNIRIITICEPSSSIWTLTNAIKIQPPALN